MKTVPTWGYSKAGAKLFELPSGAKLPEGWFDSPAKIPDGGSGEGGGLAVAASHPPPQAPPQSIDLAELEETRRLLAEAQAENQRLTDELTAARKLLEQWESAAADLPPAPRTEDGPSIGEILEKADAQQPPQGGRSGKKR